MHKILEIISWVIAFLGVMGIVLTQWGEADVFLVSLIMFIVGVILILFLCKKTRKYIFDLFDLFL